VFLIHLDRFRKTKTRTNETKTKTRRGRTKTKRKTEEEEKEEKDDTLYETVPFVSLNEDVVECVLREINDN
jgi:hypothetical protein